MIYLDEYYDSIEDLVEKMTEYSNDPEALAEFRENFPNGITVQDCKEIPLHQFTKSELFDLIEDSGNWPEESDRMEEEVSKAIQKHIAALNAEMPIVWVPNGEKTHYSLKELEEMIS